MDAFSQLAQSATSTFASTTGISMQQIVAYATSSVMTTFIGGIMDFLSTNFSKILEYGMIAVVLGVATRAFVFYRH